MITLKIIAQHFGVSTAAISKALNGLPGVSEELRTAVVAFARENNYVPNMFGKGLKGKAPKVMGVIITDNANPSYSRIVKGVEAEAEKLDYSIILCNSEDKWSKESRYLEMLVQNSVQGILIVPAQRDENEPKNRYKILEKANVPYVLINRTLEGYDCDTVVADNHRASAMAVDYLVKKGHRNIIHITSDKNISTAVDRMDGFRRAVEKHGLPVHEKDIYRIHDTDRDACAVAMEEILRQRRDFTAVYAFNDSMAFGCMKAMAANKIAVPAEMAILGYDDNGFADISLVPLTTVPQPSEYFGSLAFELIVDKRNTRRTTSMHKVVMPSSIIERNSV